MSATTGTQIVKASPKYLGRSYSEMDCQKYIERVLSDCGIKKDLAGSNAWYRFLMQNGWVGTFDECKRKYGAVPPGAFLFILRHDGGEPEKYKHDGIGNASHIGLYTDLPGAEMVQLAIDEYGVDAEKAKKANKGNGAINSSYTHDIVCTSKFPGGWNRVGLWESQIDYGGGGDKVDVPYQAIVKGGKLNLRQEPKRGSVRLCQIPDREIITITEEQGEWAKTAYNGHEGWLMKAFVEPVKEESVPEDMVMVPKAEIENVIFKLSEWIGIVG